MQSKLPGAGAAYAFPIGDGRFSVVRILLDASSEQAAQWQADHVLAACSAWIGTEIPGPGDPALRPILRLNHHCWNNELVVQWVADELPADFIPIGAIEPTGEDRSVCCSSLGGWPALTIQPLLQWRWDHDREALLAEDSLKAQADAQARQKMDQERDRYLKRVTLEELSERLFFPSWSSYPPPEAIQAARKIMRDAVTALLDLGSHASKKKRLEALRQCIESFNRLDAELHFIETIEREDICGEFEAIVYACGLGDHEQLADRWREW